MVLPRFSDKFPCSHPARPRKYCDTGHTGLSAAIFIGPKTAAQNIHNRYKASFVCTVYIRLDRSRFRRRSWSQAAGATALTHSAGRAFRRCGTVRNNGISPGDSRMCRIGSDANVDVKNRLPNNILLENIVHYSYHIINNIQLLSIMRIAKVLSVLN